MPRYFIEVAYMGTHYAGSQKQENANSVQAELEKALQTYFRSPFQLTGSSRTDAGVHARQNFFHFDREEPLEPGKVNAPIYHLNAILPATIVVKSINLVSDGSHCRFDALSRTYKYALSPRKNPFSQDRAYYYPFPLDLQRLNDYSEELKKHREFQTFAKKNSQVFTFNCSIYISEWALEGEHIIYTVRANRFLRGMVKGLVGTMLRSAQKDLLVTEFADLLLARNPANANFAVPSLGLTLWEVSYENDVFITKPEVTY